MGDVEKQVLQGILDSLDLHDYITYFYFSDGICEFSIKYVSISYGFTVVDDHLKLMIGRLSIDNYTPSFDLKDPNALNMVRKTILNHMKEMLKSKIINNINNLPEEAEKKIFDIYSNYSTRYIDTLAKVSKDLESKSGDSNRTTIIKSSKVFEDLENTTND